MPPSQAEQSPLGQPCTYIDQYAPDLLFALPRSTKRAELGIAASPLPFLGADLWTAYELSWLNLRGKPQVALASLTIPCETPNIVESKSLKLYLNSFNNTRFASAEQVKAALVADISQAAWRDAPQSSRIGVHLIEPGYFDAQPLQELDGLNLDRLDIDCQRYTPAPDLLSAAFAEPPVTETLCSHLLKSNCLVTGQPDWASVRISYTGPAINQERLLQYIVSFRNHNEFHEQCVERIFVDIWRHCKPTRLAVYARYTRRGGLDINPLRTSHPMAVPANIRTARQ